MSSKIFNNMDKLPIYRFLVPDDDSEIGVDAVALVDYPAIEMNWQAFNSQFVIEPKAGESEAMKKKRASFKARHSKNIAKGKSSAASWADKVKW